ncbi:predicted protein [Naegleria gruberi]|uniref:Predicted protein n=1 Tax=Naegleria gruberi TaxID=5762 RepID=D2VNU6_NAEGR|nr:uncharacterized protein NAEGRDRAFT_70623 [Naegleria gruberi]EFC41478.1 predicted protein [Naegleria gruberi]|eukprot:XP_002674222.1 predicted protein [Naegleria gruberi strain NEG-M]
MISSVPPPQPSATVAVEDLHHQPRTKFTNQGNNELPHHHHQHDGMVDDEEESVMIRYHDRQNNFGISGKLIHDRDDDQQGVGGSDHMKNNIEFQNVELSSNNNGKVIMERKEKEILSDHGNRIDSQQQEVVNNSSLEPKDKYHMITIIFFIQGMGELFPWNAMLSAVDYLLALYSEQKVMLWMTSVYSLITLVTLLLLIKFGTHIRYRYRIYIPYVILIGLLIAVPLLYVIIGNRLAEFIILMAIVSVMAVCTGSIQSSVYGISSKLPHHYMNTVVSGSAFAGLFISLLRILTKVTIESGYEEVPIEILSTSTIIYFSFCAALNVVCIATFIILERSPFVQYYLNQKVEDQADANRDHAEITSIKNILTNIFKNVWINCLTIFLNFFVSLTIFPGLSSAIPSIYVGTSMETWLPIWSNLTFQIYDFLGRIAYYWIDILPSGKFIPIESLPPTTSKYELFKRKLRVSTQEIILLVLVLMRFILIPLFIFCLNPMLFKHDAIPLIFMFVMSLSNGYFNSILMSSAPKKFVNLHEKEITATTMTFFLLLGISVGSNFGLILGLILL